MRWFSLPARSIPPEEEAARWLVRLENGELSSREKVAFEQWLAAHASHRMAFERAAGALEAVSRHAADMDIMAMRESALLAGHEARGAPWALAASIVGIGIAAMALWVAMQRTPDLSHSAMTMAPHASVPPLTRSTHFATAVGERSTISLPDGSIATLDTQSALDVEYTSTERGIRLLHGQALFEVAKHKSTPFQVYAGGRRIAAVGTTFNVRLDGERLRVALIEGKLRVSAAVPSEPVSAHREQITMSPGEILDTSPNRPMTVKVADTSRLASWRDGVAVFVDARLAEVVAEMNRYTATPVMIAESAVGELHVSGVFKTGDPERFAESLADVFPIVVEHTPSGGVILRSEVDAQ